MVEGRAIVSAQPPEENDSDAPAWLAELEANARFELATEAPDFQPEAALWAARMLYQLCQFVVCRDIGKDRIHAACGVPCPLPRGPAVDWSADLMLRHLPRLFESARHLSNGDPLLQQMELLGREWPLSSVGRPGLKDLELNSFIGHPALWRLYADRILAAADRTRLGVGDGRVNELLRADLGAHRDLAPEIAARLFDPEPAAAT